MRTPPLLTGSCTCGDLSYHLTGSPLFVHVCHCLDCKRRSGSAFAITTIVLEDDIVVTRGSVQDTSDDGVHTRFYCASCGQEIWATSTRHQATALLRTGTLNDSRQLSVGAHIWVKRKQAWVSLAEGVPQFEAGYERNKTWPARSLQRLRDAVG